jgi:hypothetical protein
MFRAPRVGLNPYFSADNRQDMTIGQDDSGSQYLNIRPLSRNILGKREG